MTESDYIIKEIKYKNEKWKIRDSHSLAKYNRGCSSFSDVSPTIPKCSYELLLPATECCKRLCPIRACPICGEILIKLDRGWACDNCRFTEPYPLPTKGGKSRDSQFCFNCGKPLRDKNAAVQIEDAAHNRIGFDCYCAKCGWSGDVFPDSLSKDILEKDVKKERGSI